MTSFYTLLGLPLSGSVPSAKVVVYSVEMQMILTFQCISVGNCVQEDGKKRNDNTSLL